MWFVAVEDRELARAALLDDPVALRRVWDFQVETKVDWDGRRLLQDFEGQEESLPVWREALDTAHRIGLLENGRPSWRRADWSRL